MSRKALEEVNYEAIKSHILDPDLSPLSESQQYLLDRIVSVAKILDKNPLQKAAISLHKSKFPEISNSHAYHDVRMAVRLFNTLHTFDYDFWHTWVINDIVANINKCNNDGSPNARKIIAMEHANLLKAIGPKPVETPDPQRNEKHQFNIIIQAGGSEIKLNLKSLKDIPESMLSEINKAIYGGPEITDVEAEEIMGT